MGATATEFWARYDYMSIKATDHPALTQDFYLMIVDYAMPGDDVRFPRMQCRRSVSVERLYRWAELFVEHKRREARSRA